VPVVIRGEAPGVKTQGGLLDFVHREVDIECLPTEIPEHVEVDVSDLMLGQGIRLRDVAEVSRWTAKTDLDVMLVHIVTPKAHVEAEAGGAGGDGGGAAEPEVIKKARRRRRDERRSRPPGEAAGRPRNPGARYPRHAPHVGFVVADELARRWNAEFEGAPAEALMARARRIGPVWHWSNRSLS